MDAGKSAPRQQPRSNMHQELNVHPVSVPNISESDEKMQIALVQQHATTDREANIAKGIAAVRQAAQSGANLVIFAELAFDRFFPQHSNDSQAQELAETIPGPTTDRFAALAQELGVVVVLNLYERDSEKFYDSSPVIDSDGTWLGTTRMLHITEYEGFHEQQYYSPGNSGAPVYETSVGRIGIAICYDRHYPEVTRALKLAGAELVIVPQAGAIGEWPEGVYEAEMQSAAFQNGLYVALCNRVGEEDALTFAGESFVCDPSGAVVERAPAGVDHLLLATLDRQQIAESAAERLFLRDRRPALYQEWAGSTTLRHVLATIAYRYSKAIGRVAEEFGTFEAGGGVRTPAEIVRHMTQVVLFACGAFEVTERDCPPLPWEGEVERFHDSLRRCDALLSSGREPQQFSRDRMLQGPLADVMTHVGQLAMLRRMFGDPVPGENFVVAEIKPGQLGR